MIVGNSLWYLVQHTDAISKAIMLVLLGMSVVQWTVFICTALLCYRKRRDFKQVLQRLGGVSHMHQLVDMAIVHKEALHGFLSPYNLHSIQATVTHIGVLEHAREMLDQEIDVIVAQEERFIPFLSTSAVISPLLGLLGTVWGLIHAFMSISQAQTADIVTVAPGIAEALLTTLAGLMVAIPAVVMVNYSIAQVARIERQLMGIADQVLRILRHPAGSVKGEVACVDLVAGVQKEVHQ